MNHRFINDAGLDLIKNFEGFSPTPYKCLAGYKTIGFGHRLQKSDSLDVVTYSHAENILRQDLFAIESSIMRMVNRQINDNQFAALVSLAFNIGPAAFQRSILRQKVNSNRINELEGEFLRWSYIRRMKSPGLLRRRRAEVDLFFAYDYNERNLKKGIMI